MAEKKYNTLYEKWWFWVIILTVAVLIGFGMMNKKKPEQKTDDNKITEAQMEKLCHEDYLSNIDTYFKSHDLKYNLIDKENYNKYFSDDYQKTKDEAKTPVALLSWNGKTDKTVSFMCYATKQNGEIKLLLLEADTNTIYGSTKPIFGE